MPNYKQNITEIPTYLDGIFELFKISQIDSEYPKEIIIPVKDENENQIEIYFKSISITDKLKYDLSQRSQNIFIKIRIPQNKKIGSLNVLKIDEIYYRVFNAYHFTNKDGYPETDLTLEEYSNVKEVITDDEETGTD